MRVEHGDLVDLAFEEFLAAEFRNGFSLDKTGGVFQFEIGQQLALSPRDELPSFSSSDYKRRFRLIEICCFSKKIRVQRAGQPFVGADDQDELLFYVAKLKKRMQLQI